MKNIFTSIALLVLTNIFAQAPEKFSYQAVIRDANNNLVANTPIGMQISILKTSIIGTSVYTETHSQSTNANGLVSIEIGTGTSSDIFNDIDWSSDNYFIKTETDPTGGTNYSITGTSQLLSVPYALHAKTASKIIYPASAIGSYFGTSVTFRDGIRDYKSSINITLDDNNRWTGSEIVAYSIGGGAGEVLNFNGTYTQNGNQILLQDNGNDVSLTFNKVRNKLTYSEVDGNTIFETDLTLVE